VLVESVPNVSEGRRLDVVDRLAAAVDPVAGASLLDRTSDASHNRSVFTIAGEHEAVVEALDRLVGAAIHEIDMDVHEGEHPRIGAVDVIPFIPLGSTTMDDCVELARTFGERLATRYDLPVYLYARAATRQDREKLADVRRGQYEGLKEEIVEPGRAPDFGPPRLHPSAGAVAVGRAWAVRRVALATVRTAATARRAARAGRGPGGRWGMCGGSGVLGDDERARPAEGDGRRFVPRSLSGCARGVKPVRVARPRSLPRPRHRSLPRP